MQIYNTLTRKKEELVPMTAGHMGIYACGPTVYNYIHIGNARPICAFDVLRRYLKYRGYTVTYVQNFTDVDDKIIKKANEEGTTAAEIAKRYIAEYKTDAHGLNVMDADVHPTVTSCMDLIIDIVKKLVDSGHAYAAANGDVYFRTSSFPEYGKLSGQPIEELQAGARIDINDGKEEPLDFAVWKAAKPGEPYWESPWGKGRPGWHIECSCISMKHLGEYVDIHCGGVDNIFPHHTNEIAQSESFLGHEWCKYWFHVNHLNDRAGKMSKSKGAILTVSVLQEKGYNPLAYRFFCLQSHYRKPLEFSFDALDNAVAAYNKLAKRVAELKDEGTVDEAAFDDFKQKFTEAVSNDLNTSMAITIVYDMLKAGISDKTKLALVEDFEKVLDLGLMESGKALLDGAASVDSDLEAFINQKISERAAAKKAKDFATADAIREELLTKGVAIKDTREGVKWELV